MTDINLVSLHSFCEHYHVEYSFVEMLTANGLIETSTIEHTLYIQEDQLPALEKMTRLHYDMDINVEGIETIHYLLGRIETMQDEIIKLRNRLSIYE